MNCGNRPSGTLLPCRRSHFRCAAGQGDVTKVESLKVWKPGYFKSPASNPYAKFSYLVRSTSPSAIVSQVYNATSTYTTYELFDSLLLPRQSQSPDAAGGQYAVTADNQYNSVGRLAWTSPLTRSFEFKQAVELDLYALQKGFTQSAGQGGASVERTTLMDVSLIIRMVPGTSFVQRRRVILGGRPTTTGRIRKLPQ